MRVVASAGAHFSGEQLLNALEADGFTFGRYQIFHRLDDAGRPVVSLASLKEPGTFDPAAMPGAEFRGIALFAVMPGPLPGVRAALKCRGPVTPRTRRVVYQVDLKELGYGPQPYAVADADMLADGRHIVRFTGMSLQLAGATRQEIETFWQRRRPAHAGQTAAAAPVAYARSHFLEFASGRPSRAFGAPYRPFDAGRFIARLPAPPYLFIDRITAVEPSAWELKPGGWIEAELDVPPGAWYIRADRCRSVPYCVLLEAALQPCGWLAAYMGSALRSEKPLHFRNLGGQATLHRDVRPDCGTLRTRTRMRRVSEVTDMIIEHFDFEISNRDGLIYDGSTYFGFFTPSALDRQEGIRDAARKAFAPAPDQTTHGRTMVFADVAPLTPADPACGPAQALDNWAATLAPKLGARDLLLALPNGLALPAARGSRGRQGLFIGGGRACAPPARHAPPLVRGAGPLPVRCRWNRR